MTNNKERVSYLIEEGGWPKDLASKIAKIIDSKDYPLEDVVKLFKAEYVDSYYTYTSDGEDTYCEGSNEIFKFSYKGKQVYLLHNFCGGFEYWESYPSLYQNV